VLEIASDGTVWTLDDSSIPNSCNSFYKWSDGWLCWQRASKRWCKLAGQMVVVFKNGIHDVYDILPTCPLNTIIYAFTAVEVLYPEEVLKE